MNSEKQEKQGMDGDFDNEVLAYLSQRKDELIQLHQEYIQRHPEIR